MLRSLIFAFCFLTGPALAETSLLTIGQDRFEAGATLRFDGPPVQNLSLAATAAGRGGETLFEPGGEGGVRYDFGTGTGDDAALFDAIPLRQSTRSDYDGSAVSPADLRLLEAAAATPGVDLALITERRQINQLRDLVIAGNTAQLADPAFVAELKHWLRFSPNAAMASGDGLYSPASGNPAASGWLSDAGFAANWRDRAVTNWA